MKIDRKFIFDKYNGHCAYCGESIQIKDMQVDHVIPKCNFIWHIRNRHKLPVFLTHLTEDDINHPDNLMPACRVCNKWKSAHNLELFRTELMEQIKRLNAYSSNYRIAKKYHLVKETDYPIEFYFELKLRQDKLFNDPSQPWNYRKTQ
jgi:5-methylcytosine-specific restriction endonuclease McrA